MNIMELGALGEFVGAIAVVGTLIYLSIQIRSNTKEVKSENVHRVTDSFNQLNILLASDERLSVLWHKGMANYDDLSDAEKARWEFVQLTAFRIYDSLYYQIQRGTGDDQLWHAELDTLRWVFASPGFRSWWRQQQFGFSSGFKEYLEKHVIKPAENNA